MNLRDLKSLNSTISEVAKPETQDKSRMIQEGFGNSLSAKARQVVAEQVEGSRGPNPRVPVKKVKDATGSVGIEAERIKRDGQAEMKRMMAKALNRAKKKAATNEEIELAVVAAPGYEDWASNPKVKARFKERYGKRWKQIMYGHSWNMKEAADAEAELDLEEGAKGNKVFESTQLDEEWGGGFQSFKDAHREVQAGLRREASANRKKLVADIKAVHSGKMTPAAFTRKHRTKFSELPLAKRMAASRAKAKANYLAKKAAKASAPKADSAPSIMEGMQLDEAGYQRLMRIKKAAYKADLASRNINPQTPKQDIELNRLVNKHGKLGRAAAEGEAKVAAGMARRGGASPDAIRGGGSRIGKSGKYTQKAGALANQRDKALGKFRGRASGSKSREAVQTPFGMYNKNAATKRKMQQARVAFEKKARTGGFDTSPSAKMHQMFARLNFQKKYGRLKGK